jgi:very-short-patch-repair endonuclease
VRFTDCEWPLPDGRVLVLEVEGIFHMEAEQWEADMVRQRALADPMRLILRCTSRELRDDPAQVARDLRRLGVPATKVG